MAQYTRVITGGLSVTANISNQPSFGSVDDALTNNTGCWFTYVKNGVKHIIKADELDISLYTCGFVSKYAKAVVTSEDKQDNGFLRKYDHPEPDVIQFNDFWDLIPLAGRSMGDLIAKPLINGICYHVLGDYLFDPITGEILPDWIEPTEG